MSAFVPAERPAKSNHDLAIIRVLTNSVHTFTCLGKGIEGFVMHWDGSKTVPCLRNGSTCPHCKAGRPTRWKGYLHVLGWNTRQEGFLELTPTSAEALSLPLNTDDDMRGMRFTVQRGGSAKTSKLKFGFLPNESKLEELPAPKPATPTLEKVFLCS